MTRRGRENTAATESVHSNKADRGGGIASTGKVYLGYSDASTTAALTGGVCYNCASDTGGIHQSGSTLDMNSGSVSYNFGSGINVVGESTVTLNGGNITGNTTTGRGGGVYIGYQSYFKMNGGTISGNTAGTYGGGVDIGNNQNSFTMTGGTISGNKAQYGGGVSVGNDNNSATFTMSGGTISGNTASENGGGMYIYGYTNTYGTTMSGGTIKGNTAQGNGNGVYLSNIGKFSMSESALVSSNNDVYLPSGKYITVNGSLSATSPVATITPSAYTDGATVLSGTSALLASEYAKFAVTPCTGENWGISSAGKLVQTISSGISISVPTYTNDDLELTANESGENYVFTAKAGYSSYIWTVAGKVYTTTENTVSIPKAGLPLTNVLLLRGV